MKGCILLTLVFLLMGFVVGHQRCSPVCTLEYLPVCAGDGVSQPVTFPNRCGLNYYNCVNPDKQLRQLKSSECNLTTLVYA
ncbi:turripeptide OL11-like [Cryptotermes secundus]|uniref:turripeptide OL11-like n=1 Tax=Cryptotermes secundus TaxID=105785 RepID=UPI000CD7C95A|nr:turripeptide OL11-like [Cryptotermes secundus]